MAVPVWQAPVAAQPALAGHVNQLLGAHPSVYLYAGTLQASAAGGTGTVSSSSGWFAQRFTSGSSQTAVGYVTFPSTSAGSPPPWIISLQADASGQPSGTPLAQVQFPAELAAGSVTALLPAPVTPGTQYWIVAAATGDVTDYFTWFKSSATSGTLTSPDGLIWTAQAYGLRYAVGDQSTTGPLIGITEDAGARFTLLSWAGNAGPTSVQEFTAGQTAAGYAVSSRALTYNGPVLTGAA